MIKASIRAARRAAYERARQSVFMEASAAASLTVDKLTNDGQRALRNDMRGAGLGKLGQGIGAGSDLQKGRIKRLGNGNFRVSGWLYVRGGERTAGAIEAYTQGADIFPKKGNWLWIATNAIPSRSGGKRMTPALYDASGKSSSIGPLVFIPGRHPGEALLVVKKVTVDRLSGRKAKRLPRRGPIGPTREKRDYIVAFVGIKRTRRSARVNPEAIVNRVIANADDVFLSFQRKG